MKAGLGLVFLALFKARSFSLFCVFLCFHEALLKSWIRSWTGELLKGLGGFPSRNVDEDILPRSGAAEGHIFLLDFLGVNVIEINPDFWVPRP